MQPTSDETQDLRRCVRDLVALSTLPAIWDIADAPGIGRSLGEVMLRILSVDFLYVRLHKRDGGPPSEAARTSQRTESASRAHEIGQALGPWLAFDSIDAPPSVPNPCGEGTVRLVVLPIGHAGDHGLLAAGCGRPNFPTDTEQLLLSVAVNQAASLLRRKEAEEELRQSEARKAAILSAALDCIISCDHHGAIVDFNPAAERTFGHSRAEAIGRDLADLIIPPSLRQRHRLAMANNIATGEATILNRRIEMQALRADGTEFPIELTITRISTDGPPIFTAYLRDISERKRQEAALQESEEKLRLLADTIPQLAWMARPDGYIFWYNRRWYEYTGTTPQEMEGWGWQSVHDPQMLPKVMERWKATLAGGEPFDMVFPLKDADAKFRPFLTRMHPLRDQTGRILYWFGTNTDISEIKAMEEALREADRRKDEFLATLAHELRNPLAPIRNSLEILKVPDLDAETIERSRGMMERQVHHLVRLVDDLLEVSRVMRGKIRLHRERVELTSVVARAVETAQPIIESQRHELTISLPKESLPLEADPVRLAQIVGNLLTNAAKYTEPNGHIWLTAQADGNEAVLRVRDTGIGIEPEMLPKIFDLFVQVEPAETRSQGGLGIGLTLVKNLVRMHNGSVQAISGGLGKGSEFIVRLPLMSPTHQTDGQPHSKEEIGLRQPAASIPSLRLLIVDDNKDAAHSLAILLRLQGHEVRVAHDGAAALETVKAYLPELIFLDIGMPGLDGHEVARQVRQIPGLERVVLAALTGWGQQEDRRRSQEAGFNFHLVKPVDPAALDKLLAELKSESV